MLKKPKSAHISPPGGWHYTQPETGVKFYMLGLEALQHAVKQHRVANGLYLASDWVEKWMDEICQQNPYANCSDEQYTEPYHVIEGRKLWKELHAKAEAHSIEPDANIAEWFKQWHRRVPNFGSCSCRDNFQLILNEFPPDFSQEGFYSWTVQAHNKVRAKLGQALWNKD